MLFSATQSKKTEALTALAFKKEPVYIGVDDEKVSATVEGLEQGYVICPSEKRFLLLYTFLKKNKEKKMMVFFSSCMSVKYHHELLNYIDTPVISIHVNLIDLSFFSFQKLKIYNDHYQVVNSYVKNHVLGKTEAS